MAAIVVTLDSSIGPGDVPGLCEPVRARLADDPTCLVICDVAGLAHPDMRTIDALARLQLTAQALGAEIRLCHAGAALRELLVMSGLCDVLRECEHP